MSHTATETATLARAYLAAYAATKECDATEPQLPDDDDRVTRSEAEAWLAWRKQTKPIYDKSIALATRFAEAVGSKSHHPMNLIPLAEKETT